MQNLESGGWFGITGNNQRFIFPFQHGNFISQFARTDLEYIFAVAEEMRTMVERVGTFDLLKGKILASLFYEPSTRTSSSFTAAITISMLPADFL
ncbi:MAG: hypothetical protein WCI71_10310, partial [Bacteroidota bacterium]